jgi:L-cysteine desulfidase
MNKITQTFICSVIDLFHNETLPAEGCTEPIAIALAAAKVTEVLGATPNKIHIQVSGNIIKNVKSVIVPNSGGMMGIGVAAAMGAIVGAPDKELMVISDVTLEQMELVKQFLAKNTISISRADNSLKLYVKIEAYTNDDSASVEVKHNHTNFTEIIKNGQILHKADDLLASDEEHDPAEILTIANIYELVKIIDLNLVSNRLEQIIHFNTAIANEGLNGNYGANIGKNIKQSMDNGFYGKDCRNHCASVTSAASDARMGGSAMPVITASGSGNVGIMATLPVITYCMDNKVSTDTMYRALVFSILTSLHIKLSIGRLSAHCGPSVSASAVAGALAFIRGADYPTICNAITNTLSGLAGSICDGANSSCAVKIANATYAAFDGAALALNQKSVKAGDGLVAFDVEQTINNIGELARVGMQEADEIVLKIMTR